MTYSPEVEGIENLINKLKTKGYKIGLPTNLPSY